jgi:hypothetical protein
MHNWKKFTMKFIVAVATTNSDKKIQKMDLRPSEKQSLVR